MIQRILGPPTNSPGLPGISLVKLAKATKSKTGLLVPLIVSNTNSFVFLLLAYASIQASESPPVANSTSLLFIDIIVCVFLSIISVFSFNEFCNSTSFFLDLSWSIAETHALPAAKRAAIRLTAAGPLTYLLILNILSNHQNGIGSGKFELDCLKISLLSRSTTVENSQLPLTKICRNR